MARENPGNAAFPNAVIAPNVVKQGFNISACNFETPRPFYELCSPAFDGSGTGGMHQAKSLIIALDQEDQKQIETIDYSVYSARINSLPESAAIRVFGRLMVIRNLVGNTRKLIFDPILTDNTPFLDAEGATANRGINWGPMFDWTKADIVFDRFIGLEGNANIIIKREYQSSETIHVILTPFYNFVLDRFQTNSSVAPIIQAGCYAGSESANTNDHKITTVLRTLSVGGKYC